MTVTDFFMQVRRELEGAQRSYPPMHSAQEAYGIIAEEFDEFAEALRRGTQEEVAHEAIQLVAMVTRYAHDLDFQAARQRKREATQ